MVEEFSQSNSRACKQVSSAGGVDKEEIGV
jgi:hypothetical protein